MVEPLLLLASAGAGATGKTPTPGGVIAVGFFASLPVGWGGGTFDENFYPMLFFLQIDSLNIAPGTERFFTTTPDTVFGLLTGGLAVAVVVLWWAFYRKTNEYSSRLMEVALKSADAMTLVGNNLDKLRDASEDDIAKIAEGLERLRTEVLLELRNLAKK